MYVSLSKNEGESFAVSFSLCFLLQESHSDCDFEGGGGRGCFFLIFRVTTHLTLERYRTLVVSRCVFNLSSAKVQHCHCGSRIFCQLFLIFFHHWRKGSKKTVNRNLETTTLQHRIDLYVCICLILSMLLWLQKTSK